MKAELRSSFPNFLLVTLPLNSLLIEKSSALEEFPMKISKECNKLLEEWSRTPSMDWPLPSWEPAENSKKSNSELKDTIYSKAVLKVKLPLSFWEEVLNNSSKKLKDPWTTLSWWWEELWNSLPWSPEEEPSKWNFLDTWDIMPDPFLVRLNWSSTPLLELWKLSPEPLPKMLVWIPLNVWTDSDKNTPKIKMEDTTEWVSTHPLVLPTLMMTSSGNLLSLNKMPLPLLLKHATLFWVLTKLWETLNLNKPNCNREEDPDKADKWTPPDFPKTWELNDS